MKAFTKDIVRTIGHSKKRFISISIICALGVTMLTGLSVACIDLRKSADELFDSQKLFDVSVQSTLGLTDADVNELSAIDGVDAAEGSWQETVYTHVDGKRHSVTVRALSSSGVNEPYVLEGELPDAPDEIAVTKQYLVDSGKKIGDTVEFESAETANDDAGGDEGDEAADSAASNEVFERKTYTITASVIDPASITAPDGPVAFRASTESDYAFFTTRDAVIDTDTYTVVYLSVAETAELSTYSDAYTEKVEAVIAQVEDITPQRERARTQEVKDEANATIDEEEADALQQLADAEAELNDAQTTLNESLADALAGQRELDSQRAVALRELTDAQAAIDANVAAYYAALPTAEQELRDGQAQLDETKALYSELLTQRDAARDTVDTLSGTISQIDATVAGLVDQLSDMGALVPALGDHTAAIEAAWQAVTAETTEEDGAAVEAFAAAVGDAADTLENYQSSLERQIEALVESIAEREDAIADLEQRIAELEVADPDDPQLPELRDQLTELEAEQETDRTDLKAKQDQRDALVGHQTQIQKFIDFARADASADESPAGIARGRIQAAQGLEEAQAGLLQLEEAIAAMEAQGAPSFSEQQARINQGWQELRDAYQLLIAGQDELDIQRASALQQIADAQATLDDGLRQIAEGQAELDDGRDTFEAESEDALQQIADARAEVEEMDDAIWYVQNRTNLGGYSSVDSDTSSIDAIARVLPVIFFIVAVLVSLTTATRMVEEERGLIGLYKALGYSRARIYSKYLIYTLAAALIGGVVGDLLGFIALPLFLFTIFNVMYQLPILALHFDAFYAFGSVALFVVGIVGATFLTCRNDLRDTPATLMRPRTPRAGSRIFLERVTPLWRHLGFLNKVTARNIFRYKKRFFMTVFGIMGCTALLICGFAVRDTVSALSPRQYGDTTQEGIYSYDLIAATSTDNFDEAFAVLDNSNEVADQLGVHIDTVTIEYDGAKKDMQLIVVPDGSTLEDYVNLETMDGRDLELPDEGVIITNNAAEVLGFSAGDIVRIKDSALDQANVEVADIAVNYLSNAVYCTQSAYEKLFGELELNGFLAHLTGDTNEQIAFTDELSGNDLFLSVTGTEQLALDFSESFTLINSVVYLVILLAAGLAFVVLFTLSTTNIAEREREIATIKVLGFRPPEVRRYINKETLLLTGLGILLGIPAGWALGSSFEIVLKLPDINFAVVIEPVSFAISATLTIVFALVVNAITNRMLDRIIMVEALKSPE